MPRRLSALASVLLTTLGGHAAAMQGAVEGVAHRPGIDLHYRVLGDKGPCVILLAGGPGLAPKMLQPVADHLKDRFRCVLLEQRGSGRSRLAKYDEKSVNYHEFMADVDAVRGSLGQKKVILVGNSWGMMLALAYAANYPERTLAVATLGSGPLTPEQTEAKRLTDDVKKAMADAQAESVSPEQRQFDAFSASMPLFIYDKAVAAKFAQSLRPEDGDYADRHRATDTGNEVGPASGGLIAETETALTARLGRIACPVLVVQGRQDSTPEETAFMVRDGVKGSKIVLVQKCGHVPWFEQPEVTYQALDAFLAPFASRR